MESSLVVIVNVLASYHDSPLMLVLPLARKKNLFSFYLVVRFSSLLEEAVLYFLISVLDSEGIESHLLSCLTEKSHPPRDHFDLLHRFIERAVVRYLYRDGESVSQRSVEKLLSNYDP